MISNTCIFTAFILIKFSSADPCSSYTLLRDQYRRSSGYMLQPGDISISDNFLTAGWYRFDSGAGNDMVTFAPDIGQCGTVFPIWMQGNLSSDTDGEVTRTACIVGLKNTCGKNFQIKMKSCGYYRVYFLVPSPQASTGYCIGEASVCPAGQTSHSFFTPCEPYTPVSTNPTVNVSLEYIDLNTTGGPIAAVFKCLCSEPSGGPYWYDTYWYINNEEVKLVESRPYQDSKSWLYPEDWVHRHNMNMVVKCSLRVRKENGGTPGHYNYSTEFQAGIFPSKHAYEVVEGETITIEFTVTVPVGCFDVDMRTQCGVEVYLQTPLYQSSANPCVNFTGQGSITFKKNGCGLTIASSTWWQKLILNVTGKTDGRVNLRKRGVNLKLGTKTESTTDSSEVWFNLSVPDIKVTDCTFPGLDCPLVVPENECVIRSESNAGCLYENNTCGKVGSRCNWILNVCSENRRY